MVSHSKLEITRKLFYWLTISNFLYIVVLIILAGVLINISLGNNGLFSKAKPAKEMYVNRQEYEETEIAKVGNEIDKYIQGERDIYYMIPDYSKRISIIDYSSSSNKYTTPKDGYLVLPEVLMKNEGDLKIYVDEFMVAYICEDNSGDSRQSLIIPVAKDSNVY